MGIDTYNVRVSQVQVRCQSIKKEDKYRGKGKGSRE